MKKHAFTLVELLTVIVVIMILVGMLMPAIAMVRRKANEHRCLVLIKTLETAIKQYESQYGILPLTGGGADILCSSSQYSSLIGCLTGTNPRHIKFVEPTDVSSTTTYKDPWGNDLEVALDLDYDGAVDGDKIYGAGTLNTSVIIWSKGVDGQDSSTDGDSSNEDNIKSWGN